MGAEVYSVNQGATLSIDVQLRDSRGIPIPDFDGSEIFTSYLWPGGNREVVANPTTIFVNPPLAMIQIILEDTLTSTLLPGRYSLITRSLDGSRYVDVYGCQVSVVEVFGAGPTPIVYSSYQNMLDYGSTWLEQLSTDNDQTGFAEARARARTWLEDLIFAHYRTGAIDPSGYGAWINAGRSRYMADLLAGGGLIMTDWIVEACSKKALAFVCERQIGINDTSVVYARLARMYHGQADYLASTGRVEVDTNGDGFGDIVVDLSCSVPYYG